MVSRYLQEKVNWNKNRINAVQLYLLNQDFPCLCIIKSFVLFQIAMNEQACYYSSNWKQVKPRSMKVLKVKNPGLLQI